MPDTISDCQWVQDEDGIWRTECKNAFTLEDGGPNEHKFKFCAFCGKPIVANPYREPE